jgi:GNAT superfamily N-acetyltransferase
MTSISLAGVDDIPALSRLVERYWRFEELTGFDAGAITKQLERLVGDVSLGSAWIAREGAEPAAYLLAVYVFSLEHRGLTAEIDEFFVDPSYRGRGIGSALLAAAEDEFERRGCTNVALQLGRDNHAGRTFYLSHGYAERSAFELMDKSLPRRASRA